MTDPDIIRLERTLGFVREAQQAAPVSGNGLYADLLRHLDAAHVEAVKLMHGRARGRTLPDEPALDALARLMSGESWSPDTIANAAEIVRMTGREIRDPEDTP